MLGFFYIFKIVFRFIQNKKKPNFISSTSMISVLGITLGVSVLIIGLSAMNGFEYEFTNHILSIVPHAQITSINQPYLNWQNDLIKIQQTSGVVRVSPYINFTGLLEKIGHLKVIQITSIDLLSNKSDNLIFNFILNDIYKKIKSGNNEIILGQGIAEILKISSGDNITIMIPNYNSELGIQRLDKIHFTVVDIFKLNNIIDHYLAIVPLQDAQQYLSYGNGINGFRISVTDIFSANEIVYNAAINTDHYVTVKSWIDDFGYIYNDIQIVRIVLYLAMTLVICISCFSIVSTLIITIKNRSIDIAILKTLGAEDNFICAIFLLYGLTIGIIGYFIGILLGVFISLNLTSAIQYIENLTGYSILSSDIYFINFLPSDIHIIDAFYIMLITLVLSLLVSWYPAKKAAKMDPIRILNYQ